MTEGSYCTLRNTYSRRPVQETSRTVLISHPWSGGEAGVERAERSGGLHKRSAEDWGHPLRRAIGAEPLPCLLSMVRRRGLHPCHESGCACRVLWSGESDNVQRQSLKLPCAGWIPHECVSSQACLGLSAGVGYYPAQGALEDHQDRLPGSPDHRS